MTTDAVRAFALGWIALTGWSVVAFSLVERVSPRYRNHPSARRVASAAGLLAVDAAIATGLVHAAALHGDRVVAAWLAGELGHYVLHRAMHRSEWLWRWHRMHHDDTALDWTTAWRVHPVDAAFTASASIVAAAVVGGGAAAAAWFVVGRRIWTIALHANIAWPASRADGVVATPPFHARHHREDLAPANFAGTLPILDRLLGTYAENDASLMSGSSSRRTRLSARRPLSDTRASEVAELRAARSSQ